MLKQFFCLTTSLLVLSSCSTIKENLGIEPPEMSSTAMGAATGAAVGATAGAIIGSTSGNAGEGLLLGGGVGAVSGAVIGTELGERDQEYASHQNTLDRQQQQIKFQNRQLDNLRGSSFDTSGRFVIPERNRPSKAGVSAYASYRKAPESNSQIANQQVANQLRARLTETRPVSLPKTQTVLAKGGTVNTMPVVSSVNTLPKSADLKKEDIDLNSAMNKSVETDAAKNNLVAKTEAVKADVVEKTKAVEPVKTESEVSKKAPESCSEAEGEASRARSAGSDTDKIFYYRRALRLCKTKPEYHVEMGKVYSSIGRKEEAEFEFSKALEIDPNNRDAQDELTILMLDSAN